MNKYLTVLIIMGSFIYFSFVMSDDGRAGRTGSPGETNCNTSQCHSGNSVNSPGGSISISAPDLVNWEYVPGQTYTIEITISRTGFNLYGIGFESLKSNGSNGGQIIVTNPIQTQIKNAIIGPNIRANLVHQLNGGATPDLHTFSFDWIAPVAGSGAVTFYAAGNAANGNGGVSGDFIYTLSQVVNPITTGIHEDKNQNAFQLFPNPVTEKLNILLSKSSSTIKEIQLISLDGKNTFNLLTASDSGLSGLHTIYLKPGIKAGIYFIHIIIDNNHHYKKIVVQ